MSPRKGFKHSKETRAKMSAARKGKPHSEDRKAKISAANKGRIVEQRYTKSCVCGQIFMTSSPFSKYCSTGCKKAQLGHGIRHLPEFRCFPQQCAICGTTEKLVGDHDHATGKPRGILCRNCNVALGNMQDNPKRLRYAAEYLEKFK